MTMYFVDGVSTSIADDLAIDDSVWHHLLVAYENSSNTKLYYLDDQDRSDKFYGSGFDGFDEGLIVTGLYQQIDPGTHDIVSDFQGSIAQIGLHDEFLDISNPAVRAKFITPLKKPVNFGANGSTAFGVQPPALFQTIATAFGTNSGDGGNFSVAGAYVVTPGPTEAGMP